MTTKTLTGSYPSGYTLAAAVTNVNVESGASIGGAGLVGNSFADTLFNVGKVRGDGVFFPQGGRIQNGGYSYFDPVIYGLAYAVDIGPGGYVRNFATMLNGGPQKTGTAVVHFAHSGTLINGAYTDTSALIKGSSGVQFLGVGSMKNYGTVVGDNPFGAGAQLYDGGVLVNGAASDTKALIEAPLTGVSIRGAPATIANFGAILSNGDGLGVYSAAGGVVTNGSWLDTGARIQGYDGLQFRNTAGTVTNFGSILGVGSPTSEGIGVYLEVGGAVTNGSGADPGALIAGYDYGVNIDGAAGVVHNYATILGGSGDGVRLVDGGTITNGGNADRTALIQGANGVGLYLGGRIANFGTVRGLGGVGYFGVVLRAGILDNGSPTNATALIEGDNGARVAGICVNFGSILGLGDNQGAGVHIDTGGELVNGESVGATALVEGYGGVYVAGASTFENFGTVIGQAGTAVSVFGDLIVEPGSAFIGSVVSSGGGVLDLGGGVGTLTGVLGASGDVTVSGSMAATTFFDFGTVRIDAGASFTLPNGSIAAGKAFVVAGTATTAGVLSTAGVLTVTGTLAGAGSLAITGGTADFDGTPSLTIAKVTQSGGVASFGGAAVVVSRPWTQTAGTVTAPTGDKVSFTGVGDSFAGTLGGAGTIAFTGGSDMITGATLSATTLTINGAAVTLSGAIKLSGALGVTSTNLAIATAGVTLSGGGSLNLTNAATNAVKGVTSAATLTNLDKITGAGTISSLVLANQAGGVINANVSTALTINTGAATITNAGVMESTSTGGLTISSALANSGTLTVTKGVLAVTGAVSGAGVVKIGGGTADFGSTFTQNVTFTSTTGVLELAKATAYTGQVTGFSKSGTTSLDLLNIGFTSGTTKATYSGTTASGVLTVTDGTHTAKITLIGNYTASTFTVASDGHGGTSVVDPSVMARTPPLRPLVAAMAGFGARGGASAALRQVNHRLDFAALARPA